MAERRDYYEVLGVARDAEPKAIKAAFRRLALRFHPDRSSEPGAEERFKEIAEAYAVLGNPEKRAAYDAGGFAGIAGMRPEDAFAGVDLGDLFGDLGLEFGGAGGLFERLFGRGRRGHATGADVEVHVEVSLERVAKGGDERISIGHPRRCDDCSGSGAKPGTQPRSCAPCGGTGRVRSARERGGVQFERVATCAACGGRGRFVDEPCSRCQGLGEIASTETLSVRIPVGVEEGMVLRIRGKGAPAPGPGGAPGNLFVVVHTRPDPRFERRRADLWRTEAIEATDAVLGTDLRIPTLEGHARLVVPPGTQPGAVLRLPGKGLPVFGGGGRGNLYVALDVRIPEGVSGGERRQWERLRSLRRVRRP